LYITIPNISLPFFPYLYSSNEKNNIATKLFSIYSFLTACETSISPRPSFLRLEPRIK
jgi:hypothetical protein